MWFEECKLKSESLDCVVTDINQITLKICKSQNTSYVNINFDTTC